MKQCPNCGVRFDARRGKCPFDGELLVPLPDPLLGQVVQDRYVIEGLLGSGGMAVVYRGRHQVIDRQVALKFLKPRQARDETSRARFLREARSVNRVQHENVIDVSDFGATSDGLVYMVMEYLEGRTLTADLASGPLPPERVYTIGTQVARALACAHQHGVVHRDVKPANIFLIARAGSEDFVKLLDFGLARGAEDVALTTSNLLFGTPEYMAPEQVRGGSVGAKADLYALGCVLFEMATGHSPFAGSPNEILYKHLYDLPPRPSEVRSDIAPELELLILRLMSKCQASRPADADEVATILSRLSAPRRTRFLTGTYPAGSQPNERGGSVATYRASDEASARTAERVPEREADLAHAVAGLAKELAELEDEVAAANTRDAQQRIGAAIERLDMDVAHSTETIENLASQHSRASSELGNAATQLLHEWRTFEALGADQRRTLRHHAALMEGLRSWANAQRTAAELQAALDEQEAVRLDLEQQVNELKHRLLSLDAALQPSVIKAAELHLQLSSKLATLRAETERTTDELQRRNPREA